jgi:EamA-like transporter family
LLRTALIDKQPAATAVVLTLANLPSLDARHQFAGGESNRPQRVQRAVSCLAHAPDQCVAIPFQPQPRTQTREEVIEERQRALCGLDPTHFRKQDVIAGTVLGFAAYIWLLKQMSPTFVSTYTFVNPVIAVLLGWLVLGEHPTVWVLIGAALVVTSVVGLLLIDAPFHRARRDMVVASSRPATVAGSRR